MKIAKKRGKRGADRKALFARISPAGYMRLCEIAGERTLADALDEILLKAEQNKYELTISTSHAMKKCDTLSTSSK